MIQCTEADRRRIFNLGYYTWVEQQGTPFELFEARRHQDFWRGLRRFVGVWDDMITDFNARVGPMTCRTRGQAQRDRLREIECRRPGSMRSVGSARCAGRRRDIADPLPFRCPNATPADRHHVLRLRSREHLALAGAREVHENGEGNPFVRYDTRFAWAAFAAAHGMSADARRALVETVDAAIRQADGVGFRVTPFARSAVLSDELGFGPAGGVWVKDETHNVAGSHKARHLMSVLLHLLAAESVGALDQRPRLAIASCGNAALAAATLAAAADWPIDVFVPDWMNDGVGVRLRSLGATIHRCERQASDPPGDPTMFRFREAVDAGAIPFTVQGPENALCLDGGRTIAWEMRRPVRRARDRTRPGVRTGRRRRVRHVCGRRPRRVGVACATARGAGRWLRAARRWVGSRGGVRTARAALAVT